MVSLADIRNASLLIVDDSSVNILLLEQILRGAGYTEITTTTDPRTVCDLHRDHHYDLILLDLLMPLLDGFQVMESLKTLETGGYLPVLVLTAQPSQKNRALQAGAKDFISKPFDRVEALTRIHNMLEVRLLLKESMSHARWLEQYDPLTGLPNRARLRDLLTKALVRPDAPADTTSLLFVDIDRLEQVNDALGRAAGDGLLGCVASRLAECIGPSNTLARIEGGGFAIIAITQGADPEAPWAMLQRVREALHRPLPWEGRTFAVTVSVGVAVSPADSTDAQLLMNCADVALHEAKGAGGDSFRFYSPDMNAHAVEALDLEQALRHALERGEFILYYQPKMRIDTGEWTGVEALLRWDRPGHGLIPPADFIAVLERTGLIVPVGYWVLDEVCRQIGEWMKLGIGPIRVAVNVSGRQFLHAGFVDEIARAMRDHRVTPEWLDVEITETSLMSRSEASDKVLQGLKALGIWIAIDDFGTGYSSLAYLKRFPIDTIKIDMSFIRDVTTNPDGAAIAIAIINMARGLEMTVIAEGVETAPQLEFLRQHACDEIQGYYCSRPLSEPDFTRLCAANRGRIPPTPTLATTG